MTPEVFASKLPPLRADLPTMYLCMAANGICRVTSDGPPILDTDGWKAKGKLDGKVSPFGSKTYRGVNSVLKDQNDNWVSTLGVHDWWAEWSFIWDHRLQRWIHCRAA